MYLPVLHAVHTGALRTSTTAPVSGLSTCPGLGVLHTSLRAPLTVMQVEPESAHPFWAVHCAGSVRINKQTMKDEGTPFIQARAETGLHNRLQ